MQNSILKITVGFAVIAALFSACEKAINDDDNYSTFEEDTTDYSWDTSEMALITFSGSTVTVIPSNAAVITGSFVTIKAAGTYCLTGTTDNSRLIVDTDDETPVRLIFDEVSIKCTNSAPVFIKNAKKTLIYLEKGTNNYLSDGESYATTGEPNAALFSNSDLVIYGDGSLVVTGNYNDGISTDDGILIKSGTLNITANDDGIRGKDYLFIQNGNITINSEGDGFKSDNESVAGAGYIYIDSAIVKITSSCDAISAFSDIVINNGSFILSPAGGLSGSFATSAKGVKGLSSVTINNGTFSISAPDDAIHSDNSVTINGGIFAIATKDDAIHANSSVIINDGTINTSQSYEAIESASIVINGGYISMITSDDGINATKGSRTEMNDGSMASINGGTLIINSSKGDPLDSNGDASLTGGKVILQGPSSQPEVAIDVNGSFKISGGFLIASGPNSGNMIEGPATSSVQYSIMAKTSSTLSSSTLFHIEDGSGNNLVTFKPVRSSYYIVFSSPSLSNGLSCSIFTGGSSTGTSTGGVYEGGTYSGGTLKKTFTISGKVTSVSF